MDDAERAAIIVQGLEKRRKIAVTCMDQWVNLRYMYKCRVKGKRETEECLIKVHVGSTNGNRLDCSQRNMSRAMY